MTMSKRLSTRIWDENHQRTEKHLLNVIAILPFLASFVCLFSLKTPLHAALTLFYDPLTRSLGAKALDTTAKRA